MTSSSSVWWNVGRSPFHAFKVGKATDVDARVADQTRGSAFFERPVILGRWQVKRVNSVERAMHNVLKARGRWMADAPGAEWFMTTFVDAGRQLTSNPQ